MLQTNNKKRGLSGFKRTLLAAACAAAVALTGCTSGGSSNPPEGNIAVSGAAVKGPLVNATVDVYFLDYSAEDLKGDLVASGTTDASAAITDLTIPLAATTSEAFLFEFTGGFELDGSDPIIPTLITLAKTSELGGGKAIYATPFTTMAVEMARATADVSDPASAESNFLAALDLQEANLRTSFGVGLLGEVDLFRNAPLLNDDTLPDSVLNSYYNTALNYRTAIEVVAALVNELDESSSVDVTASALLAGLAVDLADGKVDGLKGDAAIDALAGLSSNQLVATLTQTPEALLALTMPGTDKTVSEINTLLANELGKDITVEELPVPDIARIVPGQDRDGDFFMDVDDQYPDDKTRAGDTDNDGVDSVIDAFPFDGTETADTDGDGTGDNADPCPGFAGIIDEDGDGYCAGGQDLDDNDPTVNIPQQNTAPIANAGQNQSIDKTESGSFIVNLLDGTSSSDADENALIYSWRVISAPPLNGGELEVQLTGFNTATPSFDAELVGDYTFGLIVNDGFEDSDESQVTITVVKDYLITAGNLFGSALIAFALYAIPARQRKKLKVMTAADS